MAPNPTDGTRILKQIEGHLSVEDGHEGAFEGFSHGRNADAELVHWHKLPKAFSFKDQAEQLLDQHKKTFSFEGEIEFANKYPGESETDGRADVRVQSFPDKMEILVRTLDSSAGAFTLMDYYQITLRQTSETSQVEFSLQTRNMREVIDFADTKPALERISDVLNAFLNEK